MKLSERGYRNIRLAFEGGESIADLARAYGLPYARTWAIAHGKIQGPPRPRGAAAGAWKDYGPTCKRGHARPAVRDARARRCRQCDAIRARGYWRARHPPKPRDLAATLAHGRDLGGMLAVRPGVLAALRRALAEGRIVER